MWSLRIAIFYCTFCLHWLSTENTKCGIIQNSNTRFITFNRIVNAIDWKHIRSCHNKIWWIWSNQRNSLHLLNNWIWCNNPHESDDSNRSIILQWKISMKQHPIVLIIDNNTTKIFLMPAHNYKNESNPLEKFSTLIFHSDSPATIIWSDDFQNLKIQVRAIDIVTKFNSFIQKDCEWYFVIPHNYCTNEDRIHRSFRCSRSLFWYSIRKLWNSMVIFLLFRFHDQI